MNTDSLVGVYTKADMGHFISVIIFVSVIQVSLIIFLIILLQWMGFKLIHMFLYKAVFKSITL